MSCTRVEMERKKYERRVVSPFSLLPFHLLLCRGGLQVFRVRMQLNDTEEMT